MLDFISGLINYEHPSFIDKDLDIIEEFVDGIEEYSFQIAGKINSARSYRLTN